MHQNDLPGSDGDQAARNGAVALPTTAFVSTYPPTQCGLATFAAALRDGTASSRGSSAGLGVIRLVESAGGANRPEVVHEHRVGDGSARARTLECLNRFDIANVQHEYGIFGGPDGEEVIPLLAGLRIPSVVTLHSVLAQPTERQRSILERVVDLADRTVIMTEAARERLLANYRIDPACLRVIPHGVSEQLAGPSLARGDRPVLLTWGLLGPGKGIEWVVDALARLRDLRPLPLYVVLGQTHPKVLASQGEAYRERLTARAAALGISDMVHFDDGYRDLASLHRAVRAADLVVLPYDSTDQVTSGVLVEAIAAAKPVVATAFPHATEVLTDGPGLLVPHRDPVAIAAALRRLITDAPLARGMSAKAAHIAPSLFWSTVAERYDRIALELLAARRIRGVPKRLPVGLAAVPAEKAEDTESAVLQVSA